MATRGRPRDANVDDAALRAAVELVVADGYPNLAMDRVAERAGVSKAALYRRWPNKLALATDAIRNAARTRIPLPDTGTLRDDLIVYLRSMVTSRQADTETSQALHAALLADRELAERCRSVIAAQFNDNFRTLINRGIQRRELPAGVDAELYADLVPALIRYHRETTGELLDNAFAERVVDQFFPASTPRPLPSRPKRSLRATKQSAPR
jgi:AcrR family transcriptional regulator